MTSFSVIQPPILIESPTAESDEDFCNIVEGLVVRVFKKRPDWLQFSRGAAFRHADVLYREVLFANGSPIMGLLILARTDSGIPRAMIYHAKVEEVPKAFEICSGVEKEICSDEIHAA